MNHKSDHKGRFTDLVPGVKKLDIDRINTYQNRVKKTLKSAHRTGAFDTDIYPKGYHLLNQFQDSFYSSGITRKQQRKIRLGTHPIEDRLDLHGYTQEQARIALNNFFDHALSSGFKLLVIIHGKGQRSSGKAVLKLLVQSWLAQQESVLAWCPAQANHGGSGASYVYLRNS